ncbi:hypothetical protein [Albibacillus kandeliae]|uniref:hypothetical protein n=1 Tax=Albibacillus kandeliae TaxID=2174228 RepID=UPI000D69C21F|nr:hypothetical protein [Albibacillus kandeliae]
MHISFTPTRHDAELALSVAGDALTINGEVFDFSGLAEGATLPNSAVACAWLASDVERVAGVLHLSLILPHGADAPEETRFPAPLIVTEDGPVALPPNSNTIPEPESDA